MRAIIITLYLVSACLAHAQESVPLEQLLQQSERRQAVIDEELTPLADGRIPVKINAAPLPQERAANHCFSIHILHVESVDQSKLPIAFLRYLSGILEEESIVVKKQSRTTYQLFSSTRQTTKQGAKAAPCLTAAKIERITTKLQNRLVEKGYITSRILIPEQNLSQGLLKLGISVGRTGELQVDKKATLTTHAHRATLVNAFPAGSGKALNLRDLEQGLENLRRLPTVKAEMDIVPGTQVNHSDIVVKWQQRAIPFRLSFSVDDSGNESTGKYLGTIGFSWDNPLLLNDTLSISYTKNLQSGTRYTDPKGQTDQGKTNNYAVNYQVPFGYWQLALGMSEYHYDQVNIIMTKWLQVLIVITIIRVIASKVMLIYPEYCIVMIGTNSRLA